MAAPGLISIVIPAHNEQDNVVRVYSAIRRSLANWTAEIIFVDDGSTDGTAATVKALSAKDKLCRLIQFTRNFGHQSALLAGLSVARGAAVVTMDCDLQHPPEVLPEMLKIWQRGSAIVQMVRARTEGERWFKKKSSAAFYKMMRFLSDHPVILGPDFQLLDRQVVDAVLKFRGSRPFVRGLVAWVGFPTNRFDFVAPRRKAGHSSFSVSKMLALCVDGVTTLSTKPLRLAFCLGLTVALFCLCYSLFILVDFFTGRLVSGWTSIILTLLFFGGVQLLSLGVLGEYVGRIYELSRNVPPYIVREDSEHATLDDGAGSGELPPQEERIHNPDQSFAQNCAPPGSPLARRVRSEPSAE